MRIRGVDLVSGIAAADAALASAAVLSVLGAAAPLASAALAPESPAMAAIVDVYRRQIPERMSAEDIPGVAIAVVDEQRVLWAEGFGHTHWDQKIPVIADTAFSIQSMSKTFTATAVLFAIQDGLVDPDAPIAAYLPDFHINSIFEKSPEQRITLRMLLSHTAGFAHEAPVGNNYELPGRTFEEHIASIADTWLRFPAGQRYSYSNLGVDLAGYILQVRSGQPFTEYVKKKIFTPFGMNRSTLDAAEIQAMRSRAIGHRGFPLLPPIGWAIIPSGGVWVSANDMARFLRFHIGRGALDEARLLREDLAETMYAPPNEASRRANYALGIAVSSRHATRRFQHGGGGFGFNSNMVWYPELKLGAVVLTNKEHRKLCADLADEILERIIAAEPERYAGRAAAAPSRQSTLVRSEAETVLSDSALEKLVASHALSADAAARRRWKHYSGEYVWTVWGIPEVTRRITGTDGGLFLDKARLLEVQPGLFFTPDGDTVDLRGPRPTVGNVPVVKVNAWTLALRLCLYAICGAVFFRALWLPVRRRCRRDRSEDAGACGWAHRWSGVFAAMAAGVSLGVILLIALYPALIYVPWPIPWRELDWREFALMHLPYAGIVLAIGTGLLTAIAWRSRDGARRICVYHAVAALAALAFNFVVLG